MRLDDEVAEEQNKGQESRKKSVEGFE